MYFDKNQAQIGALLGKSEDWVKTRSRIHKLPEPLKAQLRQRPRAISQMLELGAFYTREPEAALTLAEQVATEQLTLDAVRAAVRNYVRPTSSEPSDRDEKNNQRGATLIVKDSTSGGRSAPSVPEMGLAHAPPWLPGLCDHLSQTTHALRQVRGQIVALNHESAAELSSVVEKLLRELDFLTRTLEQRESD